MNLNGLYVRDGVIAATLMLVVTTLYLPVTSFEYFNFDDNLYIYENPQVRDGLSWHGLLWAFRTTLGGHWHPLTWLSLMVDIELFGVNNAGALHLENLIIHASSSALFFLLLRRWQIPAFSAMLVTLIFALHPMRLESVVWASQRKDCLSMLMLLLTLHNYSAWVRSKNPLPYIISLFCFLLGLLAKPTLVVFPLLLPLLHLWPLQERLSLKAVGSFLLIASISAVATLYGQINAGAVTGVTVLPWGTRLSNSGVHLIGYIGKFLLPTTTAIFYPLQHFPPGIGVGAWVTLGTLTFLLIKGHNSPPLIFGWLWFLVTLIPVCGLIQVGGQSLTDRWSYVPHLGACAAIAGCLANYRERRHIAVSILVLWTIYCIGVTRLELPHWRNSESVFLHTISASPDNFMAHNNLGAYYDGNGQYTKALYHYQEAVRLAPHYPVSLGNLASVFSRQGNYKEAARYFERALEFAPSSIDVNYNYGLMLYQSGYRCSAVERWASVVSMKPDYRPAVDSLKFAVSHEKLLKRMCANHIALRHTLERWSPASPELQKLKMQLLF
jgi:hypothetical protein